jgi:serine/threonine protein kinase
MCLDDNTLAALVQDGGGLTPELEQHLDECEACDELVAAMAASPTALADSPILPARGRAFDVGHRVADRYEIVQLLGRGGMGEVYEVLDLELRERVALKTLRVEVAADARSMARFRREVRLQRRVTHPNICRVYEFGIHAPAGSAGGEPVAFLTMELCRGETLADRVRRRGPFDPAVALPLVRQIASGLAEAHRAQVIHGDLKSANIILVDEPEGARAVVTDFGLAVGDNGQESTATLARGLVGSPAFMAPEQVEGGPITAAADLYALGVVLFEMVTGSLPFIGETVLATALLRLSSEPPSPRQRRHDLDVRWEKAILRCMRRRPGARYANPLELLKELEIPAVKRSARLSVTALAFGLLVLASLGLVLKRRHAVIQPSPVTGIVVPRPIPAAVSPLAAAPAPAAVEKSVAHLPAHPRAHERKRSVPTLRRADGEGLD